MSGRTKNQTLEALPGPLVIALGLSLVTLLLALLFTKPAGTGTAAYSAHLLLNWYDGFWGLLAFTMQMMLILGLGHILALTPVVSRIINASLGLFKTAASAAFFITLFTLIAAYINWGLGLVFGAIMARKAAEYAAKHHIPVNYPLLGAAGYSAMVVWHGGLSGSAPLVIAKEGHFLQDAIGVVPVSQTIFSTPNLLVVLGTLVIMPTVMALVAKKAKPTAAEELPKASRLSKEKVHKPNWFIIGFGALILVTSVIVAASSEGSLLNVLNLNFVNFFLLGLGLILMGSFGLYLRALNEAIVSTSGIFIQFPFYAGIMGVMSSSGLMALLADFFVGISTDVTFPLYTFASAALVNIFVPSGGGQWAVQGPIIVEAAAKLSIPIEKAVMALAYGDQLTNMIQPFWALPLLGITGLKAEKLLPYTLIIMAAAAVIYLSALLLW